MIGMFQSIGDVFVFALLFGVALPALFAVGIRAMAYGVGGDAEVSHERPHPVGRIIGIVCFAAVVASIGYGIFLIVHSGLHGGH